MRVDNAVRCGTQAFRRARRYSADSRRSRRTCNRLLVSVYVRLTGALMMRVGSANVTHKDLGRAFWQQSHRLTAKVADAAVGMRSARTCGTMPRSVEVKVGTQKYLRQLAL